MTEYIELIEKFLRGQMSQEEEGALEASLTTDAHLRLYAFIVAYILRKQKTG